MERAQCDLVVEELRGHAEKAGELSRFPLDAVLGHALKQGASRKGLVKSQSEPGLSDLLTLIDVTAVGAARAIKRIAASGDDITGVRDALVDLWGRAEAARCLLVDSQGVFSSAEAADRVMDLWETGRLLAPDAIAIAMRLSEPVGQYVDFASKVMAAAPSRAA
jgi:hypothetical protein